MNAIGSKVARYARPGKMVFSVNKFFPELVALGEIRAEHPDFDGCGALGTIVRLSDGRYQVRVSKQYQIGGRQFVFVASEYDTLMEANRSLVYRLRACFEIVVTNKFANILGETVL